jgi:tetratricopeptide (TPR) repeat protein
MLRIFLIAALALCGLWAAPATAQNAKAVKLVAEFDAAYRALNFRAATDAAELLTKQYSNETIARTAIAYYLFLQKNYSRAWEFARLAQPQEQGKLVYTLVSSNIGLKTQNYPEVLTLTQAFLDKATDKDPRRFRANILAHRAQAQKELRKYEDALKTINAALALEPTIAGYLTQRAEIYYWLKRPVDALKELDNLIETYGSILSEEERITALRVRAECQFTLEKYTESLEAWTELLELAPEDIPALRSRAEVYMELEQTRNACGDLKKAAALGDAVSKTNLQRLSCN